MENYIEILDKLLVSKKNRGGKINKKDGELYSEAWTSLIKNEGGFSELAEKYFYDGFVYTGSKPLVKWILGEKDKFKALTDFLSGSKFGRDANITFRALVSILANLLSSDVIDNTLLCPIIKLMPSQSKNKDKKTLGDAHRIFLKNFVNTVKFPVNSPDLKALGLNSGYIMDFISLIDELICKVKSMDLTEKQIMVIEKTIKWIHPESIPSRKIDDSTLVNENKKQEQFSGIKKVDEEQENSGRIADGPVDLFQKLDDLLKQSSVVNNALKVLNANEKKSASEEIAKLKQEMEALKQQNDLLIKTNVNLKSSIADNEKVISSLNYDIGMLNKDILKLKEVIVAKDSEISERNSMMDALIRDRNKQQDEQINRIASSLKIDYKDFKDAEKLAMDTDLGENMREQLKNVFAILIKAGIVLE